MTEAKKIEITRKAMPMAPVSIDRDDSARLSWIVTAASDFPYEALTEPRMWANLANYLNLKDKIEVWADDLSWAAEFRVIDKGAFGVKVAPWGDRKEFAVEIAHAVIPDGFQVAYKGAALRWCVIRKSDNARIFEKCQEEGQAVSWLLKYVSAQK